MVHSLPIASPISTSEPDSVDSRAAVESNRSTSIISSSVPERPNPFDAELFMDERHFERNYGEGTAPEVSNSELGISSNHFASSGQFGLSNIEELELAIDTCKDLIRSAEGDQAKKRSLVKKLIELRIKLLELKEGPTEISEPCRELCGHRFQNQSLEKSNRYCERCNGIIWAMFQPWFRCKVCGYRAHEKCLNSVTRFCAGAQAKENPSLLLRICPERGLAVQKYRCAECKVKLSFTKEIVGQEPRLCDYSGRFYCQNCHWNDEVVIPARVVHNWDFEPQKVSRSNKQYLKLVHRKPLIKLESLNPKLYNYIEELRAVRKMRADLLIMKCYFLCCKFAREEKILQHLKKRQHFVETSDVYSMKDLEDLHSGELETELRTVMDVFVQHIKHSCVSCQGNGFICELCADKNVIFPFDDYIAVCRQCFAVFHRLCYEKRRKVCPRCTRRSDRALSLSATAADDADDEADSLESNLDQHGQKRLNEHHSSSTGASETEPSPPAAETSSNPESRNNLKSSPSKPASVVKSSNYDYFSETGATATGNNGTETGNKIDIAENEHGSADKIDQKSEAEYLEDQLLRYKQIGSDALASGKVGSLGSRSYQSENIDDFDLSRQILKNERSGKLSKSPPAVSPSRRNNQGIEDVLEGAVVSNPSCAAEKPTLTSTGSNPFEDETSKDYDDSLNPFAE